MTEVTVALDAMGGDNAPIDTVAGAVLAAAMGVSVRLCGPTERLRSELGETSQRIDVVEAPGGDRLARRAGGRRPRRRIARRWWSPAARCARAGPRALRVGRPDGRRDGRRARSSCGRIKGIARPGIAVPLPATAGHPCLLDRLRREPRGRSPSTCGKYGIMGAEFVERRARHREPAGRPALDRRGGLQGHRRDARGPLAPGGVGDQLRRQLRGPRRAHRRVPGGGRRRLRRQRAAEGARGRRRRALLAAAGRGRRELLAGEDRRPRCCAPRCAPSAPRPTPRTTAARTSWASAEWCRSRTGTRIRPRSATP